MKIGKRLSAIDNMVVRSYQHIWDCCCDHGHLGMALLERERVTKVHFVDIVPAIMHKLSQRLSRSHSAKERWEVHCIDVQDLPLDDFGVEACHLIIIAGVGGEQTLLMVQALLSKYPDHQLEFLLCPLRHQYKLRRGLCELQLTLVGESLVKEQKWYYEIIHVTSHNRLGSKGLTIVAAGSLIWDVSNELHRGYLEQMIGHYQRSLRRLTKTGETFVETQKILGEYRQILLKLTT